MTSEIEFHNIKKILETKSFFEKKDNIYIDKRADDYAKNFGIQWNKFPLTQLDSCTGFPLSKNRLLKSSKWNMSEIKNKLIIELGSGAGRFTEILLSAGCYVISVEMSDAIYVNSSNNKSDKIIFVKSSLYNLEFFQNLFDYVLCYGVAQHTPNLFKTYKSCLSFGKKKGKISIDHYIKLPYPTTKSIWRPITKSINPNVLFKIIKFYIPYYFPFDTLIKRKLPPIISKIIRPFFPIPCFNYTDEKDIPQNKEKLVEWAIMDTFDALGAKFDKPLNKHELENIAKEVGLNTFEVIKSGQVFVLNGVK